MDFAHLPILIGNGPSVNDQAFQAVIDSFGTVIRINNFLLGGYEAVAGTRCDIWAVTPTKLRPVPACREIIAFMISPDQAARQRGYALTHYRAGSHSSIARK